MSEQSDPDEALGKLVWCWALLGATFGCGPALLMAGRALVGWGAAVLGVAWEVTESPNQQGRRRQGTTGTKSSYRAVVVQERGTRNQWPFVRLIGGSNDTKTRAVVYIFF